MKIQRTKNAARNVVFGVLYKSYITIVPFFIRTAIIYFLGVQYLGLNGIFASILNVLNLAELGVGEAMVFSMYKPIAEDDAPTISALMNLYRKYYRLIGLVIGALGLLLLPFLRYLIKDELPRDVNLYILYLMYLSVTVLSYWLYAYKGALLRAHQRSDVTSKITIAVVTSKYLFQFLALILTRNYYLFTIALIATQILQNIVTAKVVDRLYPDYQPRGELPPEKIKEIGGRIRDLFTVKISTVVVTSADAVVVSAFLGLHTLAIYQNYFIILTSVTGMMEILFSACLAGIGNSIVVEGNPGTNYPRIASNIGNGGVYRSSHYYRNAAFLRLKNLEIGYSIPGRVFGHQVGIKNIRVYGAGYNLLTFSELKTIDPETSDEGYQTYPQVKILNVGVKVTF